MVKYKIGVWGQFGDGGKIADGQAVRTTIITRELVNRYGEEAVSVLNTNKWMKNPFIFLWQSYNLIKESQYILIAPADNGFKVFVPILTFLNSFVHHDLIYIVIGGFLPKLLDKHPVYIRMINQFKGIFVQTANLKKDLEIRNIQNLYILSNLKNMQPLSDKDLIINSSNQIKVCYFSRVNKEKGIEDAIEAIKIANKRLGEDYVTMDVYGLIQDYYKDIFAQLLKDNSSIIQYNGIIKFDETVNILKKYFCMLFPTYYYGEGFPGCVVDAYYSALPIIATDWLYNTDVIKDGYNGLIVPIKSPDAIADAIIKLYNDRKSHLEIRKNNLLESNQYRPDKVLKSLYNILDK